MRTRRIRPGAEILDAPDVDPRLVRRSLADVARSNVIFGGTRAVLRELERVLPALPASATLLDVGTGLGDIPEQAQALARRHGVALRALGLDSSETLARAAGERLAGAVRGTALALPFRDGAIDVVTCSQVLHHFGAADGGRVLAELDRVARRRVIVSDIRRSRLAAAGLWLASFPLGFHPVSRHDGVLSVLRGFRPRELRALVAEAVGHAPAVRRHLGFRVTAAWVPSRARQAVAREPLGPLPDGRTMTTVDERLVRASVAEMFAVARDVARWPALLRHYRLVRVHERWDGGGVVEMAADRPFGVVRWPTWWLSRMTVDPGVPSIRFRHIEGLTAGMDVEWRFEPAAGGSRVRIVHVWNGPPWPLVRGLAARAVIGPLFVHGIASRTLAGLARHVEASRADAATASP